ncbi:ribosome maturation factor RimP [Dethiothermospora halolimnae]|uniref:ribosome maturation factor RimP n=1 Tax=Dethiothermospora halolimnae TaxID=3114390 RepID=UPI003CCBB0F5
MKKSQVEKLSKEIAHPILDELNFELVDVEYVKEGPHKYLRIYADKPGGINIDDCQKISEQLSAKLDEVDPIKENYFLEVSSPGIDRPLKSDSDFEKALNDEVELQLYKALNNQKRYSGTLIDFDNETVTIDTEQDKEFKIDRNIISKINLAVKF